MDARARERLALCRRIAKKAGAILKSKGAAEKKGLNPLGHHSIVADLEIEKMVAGELANSASLLVSEEGGEIELKVRNGEIVVCDPLDGSRNFRHGVPPHCIALSFSKSRSYSGIYFSYVKDLASGNEFWACREKAYRDGKRIATSRTMQLQDARIEIDCAKRMQGYARFLPLLSRVKDTRRLGANALALCHLACGATDAFIDLRGTLSIVHVAGLHIAEKAGAALSDEKGTPLQPKLELKESERLAFVASANRALHAKVLERLGKG
jgi:myo-inositol-1(or 4)-monophosphatase